MSLQLQQSNNRLSNGQTTSGEESWECMFQKLVEYKAKHGDVPEKNTMLGQWVRAQHALSRGGNLEYDKVTQLAELGFARTHSQQENLTAHDAHFEARLQETAEYIRKEGVGWVPLHTPEFRSLGNWAAQQRSQKKAGRLSISRQLALEDIGFLWESKACPGVIQRRQPSNRPCDDAKFEAMLHAVAEYIRKRADGWVPKHTPECPKIGTWARNQRCQKKAGKLSASKQSALEKIGFVWEKNPLTLYGDTNFETMLQVTAEYIRALKAMGGY